MDMFKLAKTTAVFLSLTAGLFSYLVHPSLAVPNVYVYPSMSWAEPNESFTIDIRISGATNVYAYEFRLGWNSSVLNFVNVTEGPFLKGIEQNPTYFLNRTYQDQIDTDYIGVACTRMGYVQGVSGNGTLATVTLKVEETGGTALDLFGVKLLDDSAAPIEIPSTSTDGFLASGFLAKYAELLQKYNELLTKYDELFKKYSNLVDEQDHWKSEYEGKATEYDSLRANHTDLKDDYNNLQTSYNSLQSNYDTLQATLDSLISDLGTARNLSYIFIMTTIVFIASTIYLAARKPKLKPN